MRSISVTVDVDVQDVLNDLPDAMLREECARREIRLVPDPKDRRPKLVDHLENERYVFDTLVHDLRVAYLARDQQYFDVLMCRLEGRYKEPAAGVLAAEKVAA